MRRLVTSRLITIYSVCCLVLNFILVSQKIVSKFEDERVHCRNSEIKWLTTSLLASLHRQLFIFHLLAQQPIYSPRLMVYPRIRQLYQFSFIIDLPRASYGPQTEWLFFPKYVSKGWRLTNDVVRPIVVMFVVFFCSHYENTPFQIYGIFHLQKLKIYR